MAAPGQEQHFHVKDDKESDIAHGGQNVEQVSARLDLTKTLPLMSLCIRCSP